MKASSFFTSQEKNQIVEAIKTAEHESSGEIRVHLEVRCKGDVLDRASKIFARLKMHKTHLRHGILFYLAIEDKKFAIIGDVGIHNVVPPDFWNNVKDAMQKYFIQSKFTDGLVHGILLAGEKLKTFFPHQADEANELSDDISFGKN